MTPLDYLWGGLATLVWIAASLLVVAIVLFLVVVVLAIREVVKQARQRRQWRRMRERRLGKQPATPSARLTHLR